MELMVLRGKVKSGENNLSYWMKKLNDLYTIKTGMNLFPGSLNIELEEPFILPENVIRLEKEEYGGTVSLSMYPCEIFERKAYILRTDKHALGIDQSLAVIEVITDIKLRDKYNLSDGDIVEVRVAE